MRHAFMLIILFCAKNNTFPLPPKNVCILILRTYGFVTLNGISDFEDTVKDLEMESLSQII